MIKGSLSACALPSVVVRLEISRSLPTIKIMQRIYVAYEFVCVS